MGRLLLLLLGAFLTFMLFVVFGVWSRLQRWLEQRRRARLELLRAQHQRLQHVISGLMAKANDVDQEIQYLGASLEPAISARLAQACTHLVALSESMSGIEELLVREDLAAAREAVLQSCRIAVRISDDVHAVRESAFKVSCH